MVAITGNTFPVKEQLRKLGGKPEKRNGVWVWQVPNDKEEEAKQIVAGATKPSIKQKQDPHDIRLTGKCRYKNREYYAGAITKDGLRVRLLTLPDANGDYLDFWADCSQVEQTKTYTPREVWDGRRNSSKTIIKYTTLGSIADFISEQRQAKANGEQECASCGKRGSLHQDLEDGMMKCYKCCDIPE